MSLEKIKEIRGKMLKIETSAKKIYGPKKSEITAAMVYNGYYDLEKELKKLETEFIGGKNG